MLATLDRFEGDTAVLLIRNGESIRVDMPVVLLPAGCREGDILDVSITRNEKETEDSKSRISGMIERLRKKNQCGPGFIQPEE